MSPSQARLEFKHIFPMEDLLILLQSLSIVFIHKAGQHVWMGFHKHLLPDKTPSTPFN